MDLARKMTRAEVRELSDVDKKERKRLQQCINAKKYYEEHKEEKKEYMLEYNSKYYENNKEKIKENVKEYRENNKEKIAETQAAYFQSPIGKKNNTISRWKTRGLEETKEELDIIYELYLTQELCYSCDVKLTRDGIQCATDPNMDHDHITNRFRQICCRECNSNDKWMKYWC
tara:strand:- start:20 stop:538 length:519 start_codon:yes stop_codon:yes gene_type:complete